MDEKQYIVFDKYDLDKAITDGALPNDVIDRLETIEQVCKDGRIYRGEINAHYLVIDQTHPGYESVCKYANELSAGVAGSICKAITVGQLLATMTELPIDELVGMRIDELVPIILHRHCDEAVKPAETQTVAEAEDTVLEQYTAALGKRIAHIIGRPVEDLASMSNHALIQAVCDAGHPVEDVATSDGATQRYYKALVGGRIEHITGQAAQYLAIMTDSHLIKTIRECEPPRMQAKSVIPDPRNAEENTERMLSLRSKELNRQEEELQKAIRKHNSEVDMFNREVSSIMDGIRAPVGYESLARILCEVMHQAAIGKGAQRHADSNPFERQPTLGYARKYNSPVGLLCQIMKKLDEYDRLDGVARRRELIGVMVYVAMLIIFDQEMHGYPVKQPEGVKGILYPVSETKA